MCAKNGERHVARSCKWGGGPCEVISTRRIDNTKKLVVVLFIHPNTNETLSERGQESRREKWEEMFPLFFGSTSPLPPPAANSFHAWLAASTELRLFSKVSSVLASQSF